MNFKNNGTVNNFDWTDDDDELETIPFFDVSPAVSSSSVDAAAATSAAAVSSPPDSGFGSGSGSDGSSVICISNNRDDGNDDTDLDDNLKDGAERNEPVFGIEVVVAVVGANILIIPVVGDFFVPLLS